MKPLDNMFASRLASLQDLYALRLILFGDARKCIHMIHEYEAQAHEDEQFWRRALVRALFADVEGLIYRMKNVAVQSQGAIDVHFTPAEIDKLLDRSYEVDDQGGVVQRPAKINLKNNMPFAFKYFARAHLAEYQLPTNDKGWQDFRQAIKIRDRLMHPKEIKDVHVTDEDVAIIVRAFNWFGDAVDTILDIARNRLDELNAERDAPELL